MVSRASTGTSRGAASSIRNRDDTLALLERDNLPAEDAECAIVLRRATDIGMGRGMDLDSIPVATELPKAMAGICHTMQPGVAEVAFRHVGSIRDFARTPEQMLAD